MTSVYVFVQVALALVILVLGGLIVGYSLSSWRRHHTRPTLFAAVGFGALIASILIPGVSIVGTSSQEQPPIDFGALLETIRLVLFAGGVVTIFLGLHLRAPRAVSAVGEGPTASPDTLRVRNS